MLDTARKRSLGEGNNFLRLSVILFGGGGLGWLSHYMTCLRGGRTRSACGGGGGDYMLALQYSIDKWIYHSSVSESPPIPPYQVRIRDQHFWALLEFFPSLLFFASQSKVLASVSNKKFKYLFFFSNLMLSNHRCIFLRHQSIFIFQISSKLSEIFHFFLWFLTFLKNIIP